MSGLTPVESDGACTLRARRREHLRNALGPLYHDDHLRAQHGICERREVKGLCATARSESGRG